jgi:site-specific recombinase XerD
MHPRTHQAAILALRAAQLQVGHRIATRKQYRHWVIRYREARMARQCHDLQSYLTRLATVEKLNPKTVRQALNALKFYHEKVLGIEIAPNSLDVPKINPHRNIPDWLSHAEAVDLLSRMSGEARLQAELLYGTGSRITALLTLRLKDVDLAAGILTFRHDKGGKSRTVRIPRAVHHRLSTHIATVRLQWEADRSREIIYPHPEPSLMKKLGPRRFGTLPFCWLFPSREVRGNHRWHATDHALSLSLRRAAEAAGLTKRVTPHTLRHSNATALLHLGENIRSLQEHLGHTHVATTEIYTHATGHCALQSPLDRLPAPLSA